MRARRVGGSGEAAELLHHVGISRHSLDAALDRGDLFREKVEGVWLYGTTEDSVEVARAVVHEAVEKALAAWFVTSSQIVAGYVSKHASDPQLSKSSVRALLREAIRKDLFPVIGLLTADWEPYLALLAHDDEEELNRQLEATRERLGASGRCGTSDLPAPLQVRTQNAWRWAVLQHAEYLGMGYTEDGALLAWS